MFKKLDDAGIDRGQFEALVQHWKSDEAQKISIINGENRKKYQDPHCNGTKTFAQLKAEKAAENEGKEPSRAELYIESRTRKNGTPVTDEARDLMNALKDKLNEDNECPSSNGPYWCTDVFSKVIGLPKKGVIRCVGTMPTSKKEMSSSSNTVNDLVLKLQRHERLLGVVCGLWNKRFPGESIEDILAAEYDNNQEVETSDVGSAQRVSPREHRSSNSSNHPSTSHI